MGTCSSTRVRHGFLVLAVLVILSLGATAALAGAPASLLFQSPPPTPPPNDNFANATIVTEPLPFSGTSNTTYATVEDYEPQLCDYSPTTVWYKFTPTDTGAYRANTEGSAYAATLTVYRGTTLTGLLLIHCGSTNFTAMAGDTYYFQVGSPTWSSPGDVTLNVSLVPPPPNDKFADAIAITGLPYEHEEDLAGATLETGEPTPSCFWTVPSRSIWYSYLATTDGSLSAYASAPYSYFNVGVAVYKGDGLTGLTQLSCESPNYPVLATFTAQAGVTYHFQVENLYDWDYGVARFGLEVTPPPNADFWWSPYDATKYDTLTFCDTSNDPGNSGWSEFRWDFGDGATSTENCAYHQYAADGDYAVVHTVATIDGRTGSVTKDVSVRTHDIAITKFTVPQSAGAGQTRQIVVGLRNYAYPENVRVELYKSVVNGEVQVGTLLQQVPVRSGNRTTDFNLSYTFTSDDAKMGKVTFRAVASIDNRRDALPADNMAISSPVKVGGKK